MRSRNIVRKVLSLAIVFAVLVSISIPVQAHENTSQARQNGQENREAIKLRVDEKKHENVVRMLERYLSISESGNIILNAPQSLKRRIDAKMFSSFIIGLEQTNRMINEGYLVANEDFSIRVTDKYLEKCSNVLAEGNTVCLEEGVKLSSFSGVNKIVYYWWGYKLWLSNANCIKIAGGYGVLGALALFIPDPVICKILCAACLLCASIITIANSEGRGVIVRYTIGLGVTGIWSQ
ncbi:MAG: hypothetical protein JW817_01095 [Clostridiales bacterium]|nr:hypothetical protein [Clostridiales bacterium]